MEGYRMQRWLKRAGLILFFGLWAAAGLQIWAKKQESREMEAVAAFSNIGTDNRSGIVQYYGKLKKEDGFLTVLFSVFSFTAQQIASRPAF